MTTDLQTQVNSLQAKVNGLTSRNETLAEELRNAELAAAQAVLALVETQAVLTNILNLPAFKAIQEGGYYRQIER